MKEKMKEKEIYEGSNLVQRIKNIFTNFLIWRKILG